MRNTDLEEAIAMVQQMDDIASLVKLYRRERKRVHTRISRAEVDGFGENYAIRNAKLATELTPTELLAKARTGAVTDTRVVTRLQNAVIEVMLKGEHHLLTKKGRERFNTELLDTLHKNFGGRFKIDNAKQLAIFTSIMEKMRSEKLDTIYSSDSIAIYAYKAAVAKDPAEFVKAFDIFAEKRSAVGKTKVPEIKKTIKARTIRNWGKKK